MFPQTDTNQAVVRRPRMAAALYIITTVPHGLDLYTNDCTSVKARWYLVIHTRWTNLHTVFIGGLALPTDDVVRGRDLVRGQVLFCART